MDTWTHFPVWMRPSHTQYLLIYKKRSLRVLFSESISLLLFSRLANHPRLFRVEVTLSRRLMVSQQCRCHSHPSPSTLPLCFIPLWEMSLTICQQLLAPFALCLLCMSVVSLHFNMWADVWQCWIYPKRDSNKKFIKIWGELYSCLPGQMEKWSSARGWLWLEKSSFKSYSVWV